MSPEAGRAATLFPGEDGAPSLRVRPLACPAVPSADIFSGPPSRPHCCAPLFLRQRPITFGRDPYCRTADIEAGQWKPAKAALQTRAGKNGRYIRRLAFSRFESPLPSVRVRLEQSRTRRAERSLRLRSRRNGLPRTLGPATPRECGGRWVEACPSRPRPSLSSVPGHPRKTAPRSPVRPRGPGAGR